MAMEEGDEAKENDLKATEKDALELKDDTGNEEITERTGQDEKDNESEGCEAEVLDDLSASIFGCLSHPRESESSRLLQSLLRLKTKDALLLLLKSLKERSAAIWKKRGVVADEMKEEGETSLLISVGPLVFSISSFRFSKLCKH